MIEENQENEAGECSHIFDGLDSGDSLVELTSIPELAQ